MYIQQKGYKLHYVIESNTNINNQWLIMGHSLGCNHHMWDYEAQYLSEHFHLLRLDQRGHGLSESGGQYSLKSLADDFKIVMDHEGIKKAHWLGLSIGGMIGQTFAIHYPEYLESLVLSDTASRYPKKIIAYIKDRLHYARDSNSMNAEVQHIIPKWFSIQALSQKIPAIQHATQWITTTTLDGFINSSLAITKLNTYPHLPDIKIPTLILCGDEDALTPPELSREIHSQIHNSQLVMLPHSAHLSNLNAPNEFQTALLNFYRQLNLVP